MQKIGFLGMGVMGLPMAKNVVQKCGLPVLGYDVVQQQMDAFREAGGIPVSDPAEIYKACDVILQILPTHPIIRNSVEQAIQYGKPGNVIVDLSSTAPDIILELYQQAKDAGMFLLDSPVSGGNPMAIAGTLAIMTGGDKEAFDKVKPVLECMGSPVYTGGPASGSVTKVENNMIGGAILVHIAEGYAFAAADRCGPPCDGLDERQRPHRRGPGGTGQVLRGQDGREGRPGGDGRLTLVRRSISECAGTGCLSGPRAFL